MSIRSFLTTVLILFGVFSAEAQNHEKIFWNYNVSHGLPTNSLYQVFVDSKDRVWFGSDHGVICYNGSAFKTYTIEDGLSDNTVIRCFEDKKKRVWIQYIEQLPSYIENGVINHLKTDIHDLKVNPSNMLSELENGRLFFGASSSDQGFGLVEIMDDNKVVFHRSSDVILTFGCKNNELYFRSKQGAKLNFGSNFKPINAREIHRESSQFFGLFKDLKINFDVNALVRSYLYMEKNDLNLSKHFKNTKLHLIIIKGDNKFFATSNGVSCFKKTNGSWVFVQHILKGEIIVGVDIDSYGNIWATSAVGGLFFIPALKYEQYSLKSHQQCYFSTSFKNQVFVGGELLPASIYSNSKIAKHLDAKMVKHVEAEIGLNLKNQLSGCTAVSEDYESHVIKDKLYLFDKNKNNFKEIFREDTIVSTYWNSTFHPKNNDLLYFFGYNSLGVAKTLENPYLIESLETFNTRINCLSFHKQDIYLGTHNGFYKYGSDSSVSVHPNLFKNSRINGITTIGDRVFIGTSDKGLWIYDIPTTKIRKAKVNLLSNEVSGVYSINENEFWIYTSFGLQKFKWNGRNLKELFRVDLNKSIQVNDLVNLYEKNGDLILITNSAFFTIPIKGLKGTLPVPFFLNSVLANEKSIGLESEYVLNPDQNGLSFIFESINYSSKPTKLFYRINNGNWISNNSSTFNFQSLRPGNYKFEFRAESPFFISTQLKPIRVNISKRWWQSTLFILFGFLISLLAVALFVRWRINKKQSRKRKILSNELLALQSQMNPHFTFNSLNSIQSYLSTNDKRSAQIYLADFAILMRKILEQAKLSLLPLSEEIDFLKQYMNLEKRRLNDSFTYQISTEETIDLDRVKIPSLMLQPFVENAIWHGVASLDYPGEIIINFRKEAGNIICEISDNGQGLMASKEKNKSRTHHKSTGINNCKERIQLFEELYHKKIELSVVSDESGGAQGTIVKLVFPLIEDENGE